MASAASQPASPSRAPAARPGVLLRSAGARQGALIGAAMVAAGGFDYAVNVIAGRWLQPVQFGAFVSVTAILQVLLSLSIAVRMVTAYYTAALTRAGDEQVGAFLRRAWRWSWRWGLVATALVALASPWMARVLRLPHPWPLFAASAMVLMLFLREMSYGALQGVQAFAGLGLVQVTQAALRLAFAAALIRLGAGCTGAVLAQPLGCVGALLLALWWLRPYRSGPDLPPLAVNRWYSLATLVGLAVFGVLSNLDALFVKHWFSPRIAGDYGTVVTLEKMSLFVPWAVGFVLFPKVAKRKADGEDTRPIVLLSLAAALVPGLALTFAYFAFPGALVRLCFGPAYADPGIVLGLASLAATLQAGVQIWLNYALSTGRNAYVYLLAGVLGLQACALYLFCRDSVLSMTVVMVMAGLLANVAGYATTCLASCPAGPAPDAVRQPTGA